MFIPSTYLFLSSRKLVKFISWLNACDILNSKPYGSYQSAYAIGGGIPRQLPPFPMVLLLIREGGLKILHVKKLPACPTSRLLKHPAKSRFKHLILTTPLCQHYLLTTSSSLTTTKLNDADWEKGQVTQQPLIPCAVSKNGLLLSTTWDTIKLKMTKGEFKQAFLGNGVEGEEYVEDFNFSSVI